MDRKLLKLPVKRILWIDLEMTGVVSPTEDLILEIAAIVTDWDFKEIDTYQGIIKNKTTDLDKRMKLNSSFWDANPDCKDGLLGQNKKGKPIKKIEQELLDFVDKNFEPNLPVLLGGNTIHMDRRFIIAHLPKLDARLHYRMLDVSAWKVVFEGKYQKVFAKPLLHRALDDIRGSIAELKFYLSMLK